MRRQWAAILVVLASTLLASTMVAACMPRPMTEISRAQAIDIARREISFQPDSIDAVRAMSGAAPIWRVTLRGRLPNQPPGLFETVVVEIDRRRGEVVSVARP